MPNNPISYNGRGSQLLAMLSGAYVAIAQLTRFEPSGSKQNFVDQTSLTSPGVYTVPYPVQIDSGEFELEGVCNPNDTMQLQFAAWHAALTLVSWRVVLTDGSTYNFQAYISELGRFKVQVNKYLRFTAKLRLSTALQDIGVYIPGVFDGSVFNPAVFSTGRYVP